MGSRERRGIDCRTKNRLTVLFGLVVLTVVVLASGLEGVELYPGREFSLNAPGIEEGDDARAFGINLEIFRIVWNVTGITTLVLLIPAIIYAIMTPNVLKQVISKAIILSATLYVLYLILRSRTLEPLLEFTSQTGNLPSGPSINPTEFVTNPPAWLAFLLTVGILALILGMGMVIWRRFDAGQQPTTVEMLAIEAQEAISDLRSGAALKDVVMRCYFEMSRILNEQRGIRRKEAMTPREFEAVLKEVGFPGPPVERLTQLFESARYGARTPGEQEEQDAVACLEAIVEACEAMT